jgi:uncharacterized repeat protein (TIGR01451 family)
MNRRARLLGYLLVLFALAALLVAFPSAWATPEQSQAAQTVPSVTPKVSAPPPSQSTDAPEVIEQPTDLPTVLPGTPVPTQSVTAPATPATTAQLALRKDVAPAVAWPGATLHYTLTLSNRGTASAQQIVVQDALPAELVPGALAPGTDARWEGSTLRAQAPILPPGSQLIIAYTAEVRVNTPPGGVISNAADVAAAGNLRTAASSSVTLPPAELPPTGGFLTGIPNVVGSGR